MNLQRRREAKSLRCDSSSLYKTLTFFFHLIFGTSNGRNMGVTALWYTSDMKVLVLYRPNSEYARAIEEFVQGLQTRHGVDERHLQVLDYDSREGSSTASMYDIMGQPVILVTNDDGSYVKHWEGTDLPLQEEVAGYTFQYQ